MRTKTPRQKGASQLPAARHSTQFAMVCLLLGAVTACTGGNGQSTAEPSAASPAAPTQSAAGSPSAPAAATAPPEDPATAQLKLTITDSLRRVAAGNPKPDREQVTAAVTAAGIPAATLEVSASLTPTGLEVDAIETAALQGKNCVIGQIRDGSVTVTVLPVLASGKCFVGSPV